MLFLGPLVVQEPPLKGGVGSGVECRLGDPSDDPLPALVQERLWDICYDRELCAHYGVDYCDPKPNEILRLKATLYEEGRLEMLADQDEGQETRESLLIYQIA